ncbi:MAG: serine/threonine-protein phosphatase [Labilithrix sp.]|nr:serine/threonine-protein phosphatase [Labilithrix sp.]
MSCYSAEPDPFPASRLRAVAAARTDCGRERADNQDRAAFACAATGRAWSAGPGAVAVDLTAPFYAVVCDGMGGEAGGAVASALAVETIVTSMRARWDPRTEADLGGVLAATLQAAASRIKQVARAEPLYARMGTTATLAAVDRGALVCAQVGDSRAYVLRERGLLEQITRDQTMVELLRSTGAVPADRIADVVGPNVILQALGSSTHLEIPITRTPLAGGDVVLLCSDGLHGPVPDDAIASILASHAPAEACEALVARANAEGGPDNISCVVLRFS